MTATNLIGDNDTSQRVMRLGEIWGKPGHT